MIYTSHVSKKDKNTLLYDVNSYYVHTVMYIQKDTTLHAMACYALLVANILGGSWRYVSTTCVQYPSFTLYVEWSSIFILAGYFAINSRINDNLTLTCVCPCNLPLLTFASPDQSPPLTWPFLQHPQVSNETL